MAWCRITLDANDRLPERAQRLAGVFDALFLAAGCPAGMDLFVTRRQSGGLAFYLSPTAAVYAAELVREFDGCNCGRPRARDVTLVEGFEDDPRRLGLD